MKLKEDYLKRRYVDDGWTLKKIAKESNTTPGIVDRRLKKFGFTLRSEAIKESLTKEYLQEKYVKECWTLTMIAKEKHVAQSTVRHWLKKHGIKTRTFKEAARTGLKQGRIIQNERIRNSAGYSYVHRPCHPRACPYGYVGEHIIVWETENGAIPEGWVIHHISGNKTNNKIKNLRPMSQAEHTRFHAFVKRVWGVPAYLCTANELRGALTWWDAQKKQPVFSFYNRLDGGKQ